MAMFEKTQSNTVSGNTEGKIAKVCNAAERYERMGLERRSDSG